MVLLQTIGLRLVVVEKVQHHGLRATGLLMTHLETIANSLGSNHVFEIRPAGSLKQTRVFDLVNGIAERRKLTPTQVIREARELMGDLSNPVL